MIRGVSGKSWSVGRFLHMQSLATAVLFESPLRWFITSLIHLGDVSLRGYCLMETTMPILQFIKKNSVLLMHLILSLSRVYPKKLNCFAYHLQV